MSITYINTSIKHLKALLIVFICLPILIFAQKTRRIYTVGNSVTDGINFAGFQALANSKGNTHIFGRHMIPGAPLFLLYQDSTSGFLEPQGVTTRKAFSTMTWDCISLQTYDRGIAGSDGDLISFTNFMNLALPTNPNVQFYLFSRYPKNPFSDGIPDARNTADIWNQVWLSTYQGQYKTMETKDYFLSLLSTINNSGIGGKPVLLVPVGDVMYEINNKMAAGQLPGFNSIWDLYADGIHANNYLSYLEAVTFYATMYKDDPRGLGVPSQYGSISDRFRDTVQNVVYRTILSNTLSGVTLADMVPTTGVTITNKNVSLSLLQSYQLSYTVTPSNASNKAVKWVSGNTSIATIDTKGRMLATGNGITTFKAITNNGGFEDVGSVTVAGVFNSTSVAGVLAGWTFTSPNNVPASSHLQGVSTVNPSLIAYTGNGLAVSTSSDGLTAYEATSDNLTSAIGANEYFSFTVAPQNGKLLTINKMNVNPINQNGKQRVFALFSSIKGFTESQIIATFTGAVSNLVISGHSNLPDAVEFRIYVYTLVNFNSYESVGIGNGFQISGSVISPVDNQAPSTPTNLLVSQIRDTSMYVSWTESMDNMVVWGYNVYLNGGKLNTELLKDPNYQIGGLTSGLLYNLSVTAVDFVGNESAAVGIAIRTNRAPTAVLEHGPLSGIEPLSITFSGVNSTDPDGDSGDLVLGFDWDFGDNGATANANIVEHTYNNPGVYTISLRVVDTRELRSPFVYTTITVTSGPDLVAPAAPSNLSVTAIRTNYVIVKWNASTDNSYLAGYNLSLNGVALNENAIPGLTYTISGLVPSTNYTFGISAIDASGNVSTVSSLAFKTTTIPVAVISVLGFSNTSISGFEPFKVTLSGINSFDEDMDNTINSYNWTIGGVVRTGATVIYTFTTPGIKDIFLTVKDSKGDLSEVANLQIEVLSTVVSGINDTNFSDQIIIYPNPVSGAFYVSIGNQEMVVEIFDLQGKLLLSNKVSGIKAFESSSFVPGVYLVKASNASVSLVKKLVVE